LRHFPFETIPGETYGKPRRPDKRQSRATREADRERDLTFSRERNLSFDQLPSSYGRIRAGRHRPKSGR
jgi:hypothetical protein